MDPTGTGAPKQLTSGWWWGYVTTIASGIVLMLGAGVGVGFLTPCWYTACENSKAAQWLGPTGLATSVLVFVASMIALLTHPEFNPTKWPIRLCNYKKKGQIHEFFVAFLCLAIFSALLALVYATELAMAEAPEKKATTS